MHYHTILFATDFSGRDLAAFKSVCRLALGWEAKLLVLHVQDPHFSDLPKAKQKDPKVEFTNFIPTDLAIEFDHFLKIGDPGKEILRFIQEHSVDMIALGTHGRTGRNRVFSGSVAEAVMRSANCPVMTLRQAACKEVRSSEKGTLKILVPIDFSVYGYAALDFATKLCLETKGSITILYVDQENTSPSEEQKNWGQLRKFMPTNDRVDCSHKLLTGDPAKTINEFANTKGFDYVIIGTHGRSGIGRALLGSVAEQVVRHANCPVLTVKPDNKRATVPIH